MAKTVTTAPEAPPSTALIAGKYQLIKLIGRGGMGSVWEGRHTSLGTRVAIKFIEAEYANSQEARSRFDNEAKAAATIQSKHAIQIFDHGVTEDGKPYIVMELLTGEPLDKRIERLGRLPLQDVARIFQQVARGLGRAHERGIIHRDLKPENIFLVITPDDDDEVAKVLDFGIAKIKGVAGQQLSNSTKTGAVLGTPYFMSPEQARGLRDIDHRTDLWSLGVIVFKCVTGVLPFDGESLGDLLVKICTTQIPVPSQVLPGLPPAFDAWFARALDRDPQKRFASALEMSDALSYACGVSVRRPANQQQAPVDADLGNARTMATPSPMNSPFPQGGTYSPNPAANGGSQRPPHHSNPGMGSGSNHPQQNVASSSGNYAPVPTPYGGVPMRGSIPNASPAQASFATQSPLTASTSQSLPQKQTNVVSLVAIVLCCLVLGGFAALFIVPRMHSTAAASGGPATSSSALSVKVDGTGATVDVGGTSITATAPITPITKASATPTASATATTPTVATADTVKPTNKPPHGSHNNTASSTTSTNTQTPATTPVDHSAGTKPPHASGTTADQSGF
jgi:serine/threonine-protein kinase